MNNKGHLYVVKYCILLLYRLQNIRSLMVHLNIFRHYLSFAGTQSYVYLYVHHDYIMRMNIMPISSMVSLYNKVE